MMLITELLSHQMEQRLKLEEELRMDREKLASMRLEVRDLEMAIRHKEMLLNGRGKFGRADGMVSKKERKKKVGKATKKRKLCFFSPSSSYVN